MHLATDAKGQTLYEKMLEGKFLVGDGSNNSSSNYGLVPITQREVRVFTDNILLEEVYARGHRKDRTTS